MCVTSKHKKLTGFALLHRYIPVIVIQVGNPVLYIGVRFFLPLLLVYFQLKYVIKYRRGCLKKNTSKHWYFIKYLKTLQKRKTVFHFLK